MKRSEMLEILNDALIEQGVSNKCYNSKEALSSVLDTLEAAGMKSPIWESEGRFYLRWDKERGVWIQTLYPENERKAGNEVIEVVEVSK